MLVRKKATIEDQYPPLPLDPNKREIRLLHMHRRGLTSTLHADLQVVSLDEQPAYGALSYTWGASTKQRTILLNERYRISITDNLYNALRRFRARRERTRMWVDAVCINQQDVPERSQQVSIMGDIYRSANLVSIWLGDRSDLGVAICYRTVKSAFNQFVEGGFSKVDTDDVWHDDYHRRVLLVWRRIMKHTFSAWTAGKLCTDNTSVGLSESSSTEASLDDADEDNATNNGQSNDVHESCDSSQPTDRLYDKTRLLTYLRFQRRSKIMSDVLCNVKPEWHTRAWVQQEYALAQLVEVCFGSSRSSEAEIRSAQGVLWYRMKKMKEITSAPHREALHRCTLFSAIISSLGTQSADPRDIIYCLINLLSPAEAALIRPNYSLYNTEVFAQATFVCITTQSNFEILETLHRMHSLREWQLPSWAVDISSIGEKEVLGLDSVLYTQWPMSRERASAVIELDDQFRSLSVQGVELDEVAKTADIPADLESLHSYVDISEEDAIWIDKQVRQRQAFFEEPGLRRVHTHCLQYKEENWKKLLCYSHYLAWTVKQTLGLLTQIKRGRPCQDVASAESDQGVRQREERARRRAYCTYAVNVTRRQGHVPYENCVGWDCAELLDKGACVFTTKAGFCGMAPSTIRHGDSLVLAPGSRLPMILRPRGKNWIFHGFAWVVGIENGELMELWKDVDLEYKTYTIV